ncbi:tRNA (uracil-5-)-methyltransferase homolog A [Galdieria sulphuraria]|uniref:Methyltransferase n=1 Tax=Galdieria sulphuraria TaxID=130081 RepID=M2XUA4_GALSU|nr:methyltransferase [Galdieria sulphuraria]EME26994.1 methyltransferase [Galdieria sulphuraria]GJD10995.1 tRNA (uracil-5-)-methyltransferase homolog A [Galdieria sulphuraria]|eukprot:XP_005703514.1 methyltransferase [Galdieria sulphuraria]
MEYVIRNVPTWLNKKDLSKALERVEIKFDSLKKLHGWNYSFILFSSEEEANQAKVVFERQKIKGFQFELEPARNVNKKRKHTEYLQRIDERIKQANCSLTKEDPESDSKKAVADVVAPWRHYSYPEQIRRKRSAILAVLARITSSLKSQAGSGSLTWLKSLQKRPCCTLESVIDMPEEEGARLFYRNKNEFTIGFSYKDDGLSIETVGFALGLFREGEVGVASVNEECVTTSKKAIAIANILEVFIRSSQLPAYDKRTHKGFWRQATVREGFRTKEILVLIQVQTEGFDRNIIHKETSRIVEFLLSSSQSINLEVHGIVLQEHNGISNFVPTDKCPITIFGQPYFHEQLMNLTFRIGSLSFFQTNTFAAERLLNVIMEWGELTSHSTVLDLCCGTGTIGMCLASKVAQVIGIELVEEAVNDAKVNMEMNNIQNMTVLVGKVEDKLKTAIQLCRSSQIVAIADPPRAGLHPSVIKTLRNVVQIKRLIYISCNPANLVGNAVGLCRPKSNAFRGEPFKPIKAVGVDMFPYTEHVELVTLFHRIESDIK